MSEFNGTQIYELIPRIMLAIGTVGKGRKNQQQGYQFRGIDDLYNACQPALAEHGVFVVPRVTSLTREVHSAKSGSDLFYTLLEVAHRFYAPDGSYVEAVTVGEAMDSGDKSCNKAMSAAMKYALIETFCIPTEGDNDTENKTHEVASRRESPAPPPVAPPAAKPTNGNGNGNGNGHHHVEDVFDITTAVIQSGAYAGHKWVSLTSEQLEAVKEKSSKPEARATAQAALDWLKRQRVSPEKPVALARVGANDDLSDLNL